MKNQLCVTDLHGIYAAITTPFKMRKVVDYEALDALVNRLIASDVSGIVPVGGTGEYTALSPDERYRVVEAVVRSTAGRVPVVAGILSPGYAEALDHGKRFLQAGANALLLVAPFYVLPSQEGIFDYFSNYAADTHGATLLLYDIPGRTGVHTSPETVGRLANAGLIKGMKACDTDVAHFQKVIESAGNAISVLSGDDFLYPIHVALGARGGILASPTLIPHAWCRLHQNLQENNFQKALDIHRGLKPLLDVLFEETNPGPLKAALQLTGHSDGSVRLPLISPGIDLRKRIKAALSEMSA
ncbi:4-hydroxy-tetrahydrodipicolinate synthase [Paralcaligenes ureilyticus]|uniref:4-hydroxy-tetrahydrodipicolinate synthase n=1 Tax=Paralcaligenes ureilyticus TaxID=627131 RepID=A0A4R3LU05_9BURK|nr:4-hydroxy-tetrahydrodipicolinate synthase [Paralcaligenes ureilyticus]TCT03069.1 4-hydroxy-tetrahydrodipicolinate synthase [Paralcaligenes ureilyticus]